MAAHLAQSQRSLQNPGWSNHLWALLSHSSPLTLLQSHWPLTAPQAEQRPSASGSLLLLLFPSVIRNNKKLFSLPGIIFSQVPALHPSLTLLRLSLPAPPIPTGSSQCVVAPHACPTGTAGNPPGTGPTGNQMDLALNPQPGPALPFSVTFITT